MLSMRQNAPERAEPKQTIAVMRCHSVAPLQARAYLTVSRTIAHRGPGWRTIKIDMRVSEIRLGSVDVHLSRMTVATMAMVMKAL